MIGEVLLQHCTAAQHIVVFLQGLTILHLSQLPPQVLHHELANLGLWQILAGEVGELGHCSLAGHVAARDEAQLKCHVSCCIKIQYDTLVDLTNIHDNLFLFTAFLEVLEQPFIERALCWDVPHSIGLYY